LSSNKDMGIVTSLSTINEDAAF